MNQDRIVVYNAAAYKNREKGYSPDSIRDALWSLVGRQVSGIVLDVGSGEGGWIKRLKQGASIKKIISVDIVDAGASQLCDVEFYTVDLSEDTLPCGNAVLNWVFAVEVLEHLANPRHFIAEAYRCLDDCGQLVITTPCNDSLTAKLSFLFRGYFPAFCDHDYLQSGHITPIIELDLQRMSNEAGFRKIEFFYPLNGRVPKSNFEWQKLFPWLRGKMWSDTMIAILQK